MKKVFSTLAVVAVLVGTQSCKKDCVKCSAVAGAGDLRVCEKDYDPANNANVSWSAYKSALLASPNCKEE